MDERRKAAYRKLLYWMCLELRGVAPYGRSPWEALYFLFRRKRYRTVHHAHHLGDAFHNLADFSARNFVGFDEDHFWSIDMPIYERYCKESGQDYRSVFDDHLKKG